MRSVLFTLAALPLATAAWAQATPPHDQVFDLASIQATHDVCGFGLTDEQQDVLEQRRQALADGGEISDSEIASVTAQLTASLRRQVPEGLCKPDGPAAQLYRRQLAQYGLL